MNFAPILLFTHTRLKHTRQTVEALQCNELSKSSDLIIYSDGARTDEEVVRVNSVRNYISTLTGFRSITIYHRPKNFGLARSIKEGVTTTLHFHDRVIVLEDDMVTSPHFLTYMNEALDLFFDDPRVASVHGYVYPVRQTLPIAFFLPGADCWGWATWRRAWNVFNPDGRYLLSELKRRNLIQAFDFNNTFFYSKMLQAQIEGKNDSWAILWHASVFLEGMLTLYPGCSLVKNIGIDGSGIHCHHSDLYDVHLNTAPIDLTQIPVEPSVAALSAFEGFFARSRLGFPRKVLKRILGLFRRIAA